METNPKDNENGSLRITSVEAPTRELILRDERWERLSTGTLTREEDAELRALARSHPLYQEAYETFKPWSASEDALILKKARQRVEDDERREKANSNKHPFRAVMWAASYLLAATLGVLGASPLVGALAPHPPPDPTYLLPGYQMKAQVTRATSTGNLGQDPGSAPIAREITLPANGHLELTLVPDSDIQGEFEASCFLIQAGALAPCPESVPLTKEADGTIAIKGDRSVLFPGIVGTVELVVVVARPGQGPRDSDDWRSYLVGTKSIPKKIPAQIERVRIVLVP